MVRYPNSTMVTRVCLGLGTGLMLAVMPLLALGAGPNDYVGTETCLECHEEYTASFAQQIHGRLADFQYPGLAQGCESCHGPGALHTDTNEPTDIMIPQATAGINGIDICLDCHKTGHTVDWRLSPHAEADIGCLDCHQMHGADYAHQLKDSETKVCYACHQDMQAQFQMPSRHPVRDGFMTCGDCHNVHSPFLAGNFAGEENRELCLTCHAKYAGPFIFQHSPAEEDCGICHNAHGAVANNLLRQNEPFICLNCHQPHFHSILAGWEGDYETPPGVWDPATETGVDPGYAGLSGTSHYDSMKRSMLTKCSQCHQSVHGTDLPSQSIPGQGRALNR
jgi:DmsE family decaheme c-type cytochrome